MTRSLAAAVLAAALAAACGDDTPTEPTPVIPPTTTEPTVTGVTLQAPAAFVDGGQVLMVGESVTLEACATFSDDTERCGVNATWSSSSPNVATVSATGVVTGAAPGETTISAVYERNTGRATVTVEAVDEGPWDVSGEVTDAETGQGIRRAVILVLNGPHEGNEARTNARGRYVPDRRGREHERVRDRRRLPARSAPESMCGWTSSGISAWSPSPNPTTRS